MPSVSWGVFFTLAVTVPAQAQAPKPVLASVDARWEHVFCDLTELARTGTSELSVRFQYRNTGKTAQALPHVNLVQFTTAFDAAGGTMYGVLKDPDGQPISSTMIDVTVARPIPANAVRAHWAKLEAPPAAVTALTVLVDGCQPFTGVTIGGAPSVTPRTTPAAAIKSQESENPGVMVELVGLTREAGGVATLAFRFRNTTAAPFRFPSTPAVQASYVIDTANRKKYTVLRDKKQQPLCTELLRLRDQIGDTIPAGSAMTFWALVGSPPETSKAASVTVPLAPPFDDVPITGAGAGSRAGASVAGAVVGLDAALKGLRATVTDTEIRIELAADVLFDFDKADLKPEAETSLKQTATVLKAHPNAKVRIEGHTDGKGADAYNQKLSEDRAASVKRWLETNGQVNGAAITTRGWGKAKPAAPNTKPDGSDDPAGRTRNRRVEILVSKSA